MATALFGDGAAACVRAGGDERVGGVDGFAEIEMAGEHPGRTRWISWAGGWIRRGSGVIFDRAIPPFAEKHVGAAVSGILESADLDSPASTGSCATRAGVKVIAAMERALGLDQGSLDIERDVLADNGNMSAPTALFVLGKAQERGLARRSVLTAMGPGFTASCVSLLAA